MTMPIKLLLLFMVFFLSQGIAAHFEYDWHLVREEDGIQVYLKKFLDDDVKSFKGVVDIPSSVDSLLAVIIDVEACPDWIHHCTNPTLLLRKAFLEIYHYQIHKLPFPALNREFILHSKVTRSPETGAVLIQINAVPEFCSEKIKPCTQLSDRQMVRVEHSHGHYLLEPLDKKNTRVTWTHHTNPGGYLPTWLINRLIREVPFRTLQGLRKKVCEEKYQKARLITNSEGDITALKVSR